MNDIIVNEFWRMNREKNRCSKKIEKLPKGYISKKTISGHDYYYLQNKVDGKINSHYISYERLDSFKQQIEERHRLEKYYKEISGDINSLNKIVGAQPEDPRFNALYTIDEIRDISKPVFDSNFVNKAFLFGSYSSNQATEHSDIDILVDCQLKGIQFFGLLEELSTLFVVPIDLVEVRQLKEGSAFTDNILHNSIQIYG